MFQVVHNHSGQIPNPKPQTIKLYSAPNFPNNHNGSANSIQLQTNNKQLWSNQSSEPSITDANTNI